VQPNSQNITSLLTANYIVPDFQRPYTWNEDQVIDLFSDVISCVGDASATQEGLFLGVVVLLKEKGTDSIKIVDGQQRITTLYLFTIALQEVIDETFLKQASDHSLNWLINSSAGGKRDTWESRVSLNTDQDVLLRILRGLPFNDHTHESHKLFTAFNLLKENLKLYLQAAKKGGTPKQTALITLLKHFKTKPFVYSLTADDETQGFELFETLNSKGTPLSAADLIKNKVLAIASGDESVKTDVLKSWEKMIPNCDKSSKNRSVEEYIRIYWHAFMEDVPTHRLYRRFVVNVKGFSPHKIQKLVREMLDASKLYRVLWDPYVKHPATTDLEVRNRLIRLNYLGSKVARTILLATLSKRPAEFADVLKYVETVAVRAIIGRRATNQIHDAYWHVAQELTKEKIKGAVVDALRDRLGGYLPPDDEFIPACKKYQFTRRNTQRALLLALNDTYAQNAVDMYEPKRANVEHVLSQNPEDKAKTAKALNVSEKEYDRLKNMLGNLTLLADKPNKEMQNKPYSFKRKDEDYKGSDVRLTKNLLKQYSAFGKKQVLARTKELSEVLAVEYPLE
jgi:hypothetical protein